MIFTVTLSPALDKSMIIESFAPGKVNRVVSARTDPGGKGINVSKVLRVLGCESVAMGVLGGRTGEEIEARLSQMGIEADFVKSASETRTNIKISDPVTGLTTDINAPSTLSKEEADAVLHKLLSRVKKGDCVVIAGKMSTEAADAGLWVKKLSEKGAYVFLDTEGEALVSGAAAGPFLIKPNETELSMLCGREFETDSELISAARRLTDSCAVVAVSMGEKGAYFFTKEESLFISAPKVDCVCTVGAGDTMTACLAYGKETGMNFMESCMLSVAASAAAVTCPGTSSPTKEQIYALLPNIKTGRIDS